MKKTVACLAALMTLMSLTACSDTTKDDNLFAENKLSAAAAQDTEIASEITLQNTTAETQSVSSVVEEGATAKALNSSDYVLNANFTPIYENVHFLDVPATGGVSSYEELQEYMNAYEDISFVEYEIISQYTPEEAFAKTGDEIFKYSTTLYQAHIYYDYLHDTPVDMTVDLAKAGMPDQQVKNNPPYTIGQKIISALSGFNSTNAASDIPFPRHILLYCQTRKCQAPRVPRYTPIWFSAVPRNNCIRSFSQDTQEKSRSSQGKTNIFQTIPRRAFFHQIRLCKYRKQGRL